MKIKKAVPFILPLAVWLSITVYMVVAQYVLTPLTSPVLQQLEDLGALIAFVLNAALQVLIVCVLTVVAAKKFDFSFKGLVIALPVMFVMFAVYHIPSLYIFAYTAEWSFMWTHRPAMNRFLAAFWITLQFGIIMLFTLTAVYANKKEPNSEGEKYGSDR